jgi:5-(carboxyamino)imidazole ribonucleotide synthase
MGSVVKRNPRIGVLGGGQLGRMLFEASIKYEAEVHFLDPSDDCPCSSICPNVSVGDFNRYEDVLSFGAGKDIITIEIEHVNVDALETLEKQGKKVYPQSRIVRLVQDKGLQKQFYEQKGLPTAPFQLVQDKNAFLSLLEEGPCVQKLRTGGYDGRGVQLLSGSSDSSKVFDAPSVWEQKIDIDKEISVIVARNALGEIETFPSVAMEFNPVANLVEYLYAPAGISQDLEHEAKQLAKKLIVELDMIGILAVEMFLDRTGKLWINEMAPRPHNSGHHTIEGNYTSQFEQLFRVLMEYPLGSARLKSPVAMLNLLGMDGYAGKPVYEKMDEVLKVEGAYIHLYGKKETRPFRKMGHITVLAETKKDLEQKIHQVKSKIKIKS